MKHIQVKLIVSLLVVTQCYDNKVTSKAKVKNDPPNRSLNDITGVIT